jgi:long-chain acyl-CoA synthetase
MINESPEVVATRTPISTATQGNKTALDLFVEAVAADRDAPMIRYFDAILAADQVDRESDALAAALLDHGLEPGDRVVLYLQNVPQYVIALVAIWKAGAVAVSANPMLKSRELGRILDDSGAAALITLDSLYTSYGVPALTDSSVTIVITTDERDYQSRNDSRVLSSGPRARTDAYDLRELVSEYSDRELTSPATTADDIAVITYTSGTTGAPKGATNTHRNVVLGGEAYRDWFGLAEGGTILGVAPLFHVTGLSGHIAAAFAARMSLALMYRFDSGVVLDAIREHRPTFTVGAITVFIALMNDPQATRDDLSSIGIVASGGAPIPPSVVEQFESKFGRYIYNAYGMTETTSPALSVPVGEVAPVDPLSGALSVGKPVFDCETWVVDDNGRALATGSVGELVVAGPRIVPAYWNNTEETAQTFAEGRLKTGDVGYFDHDGWFYVVDRKKDVIVASGYKVWPREVEDVLYSHPAVKEAAVVGIPDEYRGESVKAYVTIKSDHTVSADDLVSFTKDRMAAYKYPRTVVIVDTLPMTATGKILRRSLKSLPE